MYGAAIQACSKHILRNGRYDRAQNRCPFDHRGRGSGVLYCRVRSSRHVRRGNLTQVQLSEPNYKVVATSVSGDAQAAYLIGVAFSNGPQTGSLSLHRLKGTGKLYKEAMENLWKTFAAEHGAVEGRRLALANVRYDAATRNFFIYNDVTLSIRADVIEFVE